jgi:DNA mismatch repair protein MLH1
MAGIRRLTSDIINKIAAGEVVQKPSSALKELIENSLDAGSTSITIKLRDGGMSLLQIADNGTGIHLDDFPILCHRFTTSKISSYDDLSKLYTFGFRGEALSSISQVSKITVCSRKAGEPVGYKAEYLNGDLISPPQPYGYDKGTLIIVEDLFGNNPNRKRALTDYADLHSRCLDVVAKYALQYPKTSFKLIKNETQEFCTSGKNNHFEVLKTLLKSCKVDKETLEIPLVECDVCKYFGFISNSQYTQKLKEMILFINGRLVESLDLRKLLNEIYGNFMPKTFSYFVYISIHVPADEIDVNVHPTKQEVKFTKQAQIFSEISSKIQDLLTSSNSSRTFTMKACDPRPVSYKPTESACVRETPTVPLEWFLQQKATQAKKPNEENLSSIGNLKNEIITGKEQDIFNNFSYIGCANKHIVLVQSGISMYILICDLVIESLIYQHILEYFGQLPYFDIPCSDLSIEKLLCLALKNPDLGYEPESDPEESILIENYKSLLDSKADLLDDYFSITINEGTLKRIPFVIDGLVVPDINYLPEFVLRLCTDVDWTHEQNCLEKISHLIGWFYSKVPDAWKIGETESPYESIYRNHLFPYIRGRIQADVKTLTEGKGVMHVVSTETLYKIFERC